MLKTSGSTESTTRLGKGGVGVGGDGGGDGDSDSGGDGGDDSGLIWMLVHQRTHQLVVLVASQSKSRQKVKESSKSPKSLKGLKICKGHRFGRMFTKAPILHQLDTKNSSFRLSFDSFSSSFCWDQEELSWYHFWSNYCQGRSCWCLTRFSPEEPVSAPSFCLQPKERAR